MAEPEEAAETAEPEATPLLAPRDGVPQLSVSRYEIVRAAELLDTGHGPFAVDAERASGFRYSNRAYLVQIRRAGAGTVLIDPVNHGNDPMATLAPVAEVLATDEWVLHAADQDLPCLAEIGMTPQKLYDTELAGRLAGYDRVNLAAMVQRLLGLQLMKGHGAADWSKRPLPQEWLNYAALDVEVLLELRDAIANVLQEQDKTDWAAQEFEFVRTLGATPTRRDRWRRTSGIHKVRNPRTLAAVRELWQTRDHIARRRDIAPGRILPDSAIINAATIDPDTVDKLTELPIFGGNRQRRSAQVWLDALARARTAEPPKRRSRRTGRRQRRAGLGASPRRRNGWKLRAQVWPNCRNGFRCRRRTSSPPRSCAGSAGIGSRSTTPRRRSTSSCAMPERGRGSVGSSYRCWQTRSPQPTSRRESARNASRKGTLRLLALVSRGAR